MKLLSHGMLSSEEVLAVRVSLSMANIMPMLYTAFHPIPFTMRLGRSVTISAHPDVSRGQNVNIDE